MSDPTSTPPQAPGLLQRFIGIIFSPGPTMEAALRVPRPFGILFVCAVVIGVATALPQMTETIQQATVDMQVAQQERMLGQPLSDEAYESLQRMAPYQPYMTLGGTLVSTPIMVLIFTGLMWGIFNAVFGGTATFKEVLTVVSHGMVILALMAVAAAPVILMQGQVSMTGPFTLAALAPMLDEGSFLARLLGGINVFTIWQTIVVAIGLGVLYRKKTSTIATWLIVAYIAVVAVVVWVFGRLMGGS